MKIEILFIPDSGTNELVAGIRLSHCTEGKAVCGWLWAGCCATESPKTAPGTQGASLYFVFVSSISNLIAF